MTRLKLSLLPLRVRLAAWRAAEPIQAKRLARWANFLPPCWC